MNTASVMDEKVASCWDSHSPLSLMQRIAEKDRGAFTELYSRFSQLVFNIALRVVGDRGEAEEITQDVFFQIWNRASSYDPGRGSEATWLINIARSRSIDRLRALGFKKYDVEIEEERMNPKWDSLRISQGEGEMKVIIQACLDSLPPEQRAALEMAYFDGLTHYEIAEKLAKPVGTIKTRITLGVAKLRKQLAPYVREGEL